MNGMNKQEFPYQSLGHTLRRMREKKQQSLAEVSGAVEIDIAALTDIEAGVKRPSEDILHLLINYFAVKEDEASRIWDMAGYLPRSDRNDQDDSMSVFVMPMDVRVVYTDMVHIMVNDYGVVMNFMQTNGPSNKPMAVSRIGMSKEHAESVLSLLQKALEQGKPKLLPGSTPKKTPEEPA